MFHFWFNTFFVRDISSMEYDNGDLPVERSTRALSCDGTTMDLPIVTSNSKPRTSSLANLGPTPPTLLLNIDKWNLDDAHKDKSHKLYSSDFKVNNILLINTIYNKFLNHLNLMMENNNVLFFR